MARPKVNLRSGPAVRPFLTTIHSLIFLVFCTKLSESNVNSFTDSGPGETSVAAPVRHSPDASTTYYFDSQKYFGCKFLQPIYSSGRAQAQEPDKIGSLASGRVVATHARGRSALLEIGFHRGVRDVRHRIGSGELTWKRRAVFLFGLRKFRPLGHDQLIVFPYGSPEKPLISLIRLSGRIGDFLASYHLHRLRMIQRRIVFRDRRRRCRRLKRLGSG